MNMLETNEKIENLSKEIEVIKKNKMQTEKYINRKKISLGNHVNKKANPQKLCTIWFHLWKTF